LDSGSEVSIASAAFVRRNNIGTFKHKAITLDTVGERSIVSTESTKLKLYPKDKSKKPIRLLAVVADFNLTVARPDSTPECQFPSLKEVWNKVNHVEVDSDGTVTCDLLIGLDHLYSVIGHNLIEPAEGYGVAFKLLDSPFGYIASGAIENRSDAAKRAYSRKAVAATVPREEFPSTTATFRVGSAEWPWSERPDRQANHPESVMVHDAPSKIYVDLEKRLKFFFSLQSMGIQDDPLNMRTKSEETFTLNLKNNLVRRPDGSYEIPLVENKEIGKQQSNYRAVRAHSNSVYKNLVRMGKKEEYDEAVKKLVEKGVAVLTEDEGEEEAMKKGNHYVGLSGVYREHKPVRLVLNCASKFHGVSTNDMLMSPPPIAADLFNILMGARKHKYLLCQDIGSFFPSLHLPKEWHNFVCCLIRNRNGTYSKLYFVKYGFGLNQSPLICQMVLRFHLNFITKPYSSLQEALDDLNAKEDQLWLYGAKPKEQDSDLVRKIVTTYIASTYVDDNVNSYADVDTLLTHHEVMTNLLRDGHYFITKLFTNSDEARRRLNQDELLKNEDGKVPIKTSVLGVPFDSEADTLSPAFSYAPDLSMEEGSFRVTKRIISSAMGSIYDPLLIAGPFQLEAKLMLKQAHQEYNQRAEEDEKIKMMSTKRQWNLPLSEQLTLRFKDWLSQAHRISELNIPRWIEYEEGKDITFFLAADASKEALGAVLHVKVTDKKTRKSSLSFVCAKSQNSDKLSIPRGEIAACELGAKMLKSVLLALDLEEDFYNIIASSDSKVALSWLHCQSSQLLTWVYNRVCKIKAIVPANRWSYINTSDNPADQITRPLKMKQLLEGEEGRKWFRPPIYEVEGSLKPGLVITDNSDAFHIELATTRVKPTLESAVYHTNAAAKKALAKVQHFLETLLNRFSDFEKVLRIIAYIRRWRDAIKKPNAVKPAERPERPSEQELQRALIDLVKLSQSFHFQEEITDLKKGKLVKKSSSVYKFCPYLDAEGVLRAYSRLDIPEDESYTAQPILLGKKAELARRYVLYLHEKYGHRGPPFILYMARKNMWIIDAQRIVTQVTKSCVICRKERKALYEVQAGLVRREVMPSDMGSDRQRLRLWRAICIDTIGSYNFLDASANIKKCWILVVVDCLSRYIKLIMIEDLSAKTLYVALRIHGEQTRHPELVICDSFSSFSVIHKFNKHLERNLQKELKKLLGKDGIKLELINGDHGNNQEHQPDISIKYDTLYSAPHQHQVQVEGVIRMLKRGMGMMFVKKAPLPRQEFVLRMEMAAKVANLRPLVPVNKESLSAGAALLSPWMLHHHADDCVITPMVKDLELTGDKTLDDLTQCYRNVLKDRDTFARSFTTHYIAHMIKRNVWTRAKPNIAVGALCLVQPSNRLLKRHEWLTAVVCQTFQSSRDQAVREVLLRTASGKKIRRSVRNLVLLKTKEELDAGEDPGRL